MEWILKIGCVEAHAIFLIILSPLEIPRKQSWKDGGVVPVLLWVLEKLIIN